MLSHSAEFIQNALIRHNLTLLSNFLILSHNYKPFNLGILIFKSAKSYELDLKLDNANSGSLKVSTLNKPVSSRQRLKELVISR